MAGSSRVECPCIETRRRAAFHCSPRCRRHDSWAKTGTFATRNIYWKADPGEATMSIKGIADWPADTSMEALQKKGTLFIMCNNALNFWAMNVASATSQTMDAVRAEFLAHIVPGVVIVPAMVMAVNQAQAKGCSYMRMG